MTPQEAVAKYKGRWSTYLHHHPVGSPEYIATELVAVIEAQLGGQWAMEHIGMTPAVGGCGTSYHDERGDVQDCTSVEPCRACLRRRIAQLEAQRGGVVVVPELKDSDSVWQDAAFLGKEYSAGLRDGFDIAASRIQPIPADRVLGDGEERITAKDLAWFKMREARCLAWDQWAQEEGVELPRADRFESCPKNYVCTPHACEAGNGEWPRCPKGGEVVG